MKNPFVSIIIPVYNGENYLRKAIDSALAQTYKNIEVLVINDGSDDNGATEAIALSYGEKIKYYKKPNGGVSTALNYGIEKMEGEYFSWLSHDDEYTEKKVENQIKLLSTVQNDDHCLAYCNSMLVDKGSRPIKKARQKSPMQHGKKYTFDEVLLLLFKRGTFNGCAFLIPKSVFEQCGKFDEQLRYNQDSMMWYKIFLQKNSLIYGDDIGVLSRVHSQQLTQTGRAIFKKDCETMSEFLIPRLISESRKDKNFIFYYALNNAKYNNVGVVKSCISRGRSAGLLSNWLICRIYVMLIYGSFRPVIRRAYHRLFNNVKTQ